MPAVCLNVEIREIAAGAKIIASTLVFLKTARICIFCQNIVIRTLLPKQIPSLKTAATGINLAGLMDMVYLHGLFPDCMESYRPIPFSSLW